jgi:hypothetical protein
MLSSSNNLYLKQHTFKFCFKNERRMSMKIDEFMKNPIGKGAFIPGKDQLLTNLDYRFKLLKENKEITMNIYKTKDDVYYHVIIPTETRDRYNDYDVVIKFKRTEKNDKFDQSYRQYQIEFFSNCPSFTYVYAYVANLNGYLIKEFADKYEKKVLKYPPVSKNPGQTFGYEKSIYFACKYILQDKQVLLKSYVDTYGQPLTPEIIKSIRNMNVIEEEYKRADKVTREARKVNIVGTDKKTQKKKDKVIQHYSGEKPPSNVNVVNKTKSKKPSTNKIKPIKKKK